MVRIPRVACATNLFVLSDYPRCERHRCSQKGSKRQIAPDGLFSCREVYLKGWGGLDSPQLVRMAVEVLQDAGWVRDVDRESGPSGGRPSTRYQVNPKVWE